MILTKSYVSTHLKVAVSRWIDNNQIRFLKNTIILISFVSAEFATLESSNNNALNNLEDTSCPGTVWL